MQLLEGLKQGIESRTARVAVIGAGYVGLAAAVEAARAGFAVTAVDLDAERVRMLEVGRSYIQDISDSELRPLVADGRLQATTDFDCLEACGVILICVPTPLTPNREPDLSYILAAAREMAARIRPGQLISLESTTYPGTTEEMVLPLLAERGGTVGRDFFLAYCAERVDPGNQQFSPGRLARVLGGVTPACLELAASFYTPLTGGVVRVSSARTAELTKLFENTYRAVNIALVNELTLLCDQMEQDVWEVLQAAGSKPFGIQIFHPGPGVGGHCIPLDPHYLAWKAREYDFTLRFVELAGEINTRMPYFVVQKLVRCLNEVGMPLRGARILLLGVAYKRDVTDTRESPALRIIDLLHRAGAHVLYHDPKVPVVLPHGPLREPLNSVPLSPEVLAEVDAAVVVTDHTGVDYQRVLDGVPLLFDTRGISRRLTRNLERVRRL